MLRALALGIACAATSNAQSTITLSIDGSRALFKAAPTYLSFNIDIGSLYNLFDLQDPVLINLLKQLTPASIRVGGGAADSTIFTGDNGPSGACSLPWNNTVCVNTTYWDQLVSFARASGAGLVYDLNGFMRDSNNQWDPHANATALFAHAAAQGQGDAITGWQLGNEMTLWKHRGVTVTGAQVAADYATLRSTLKQYPSLPNVIIGPEGCCGDNSWLDDFIPAAAQTGSLDYLSEHYYPITPNPAACDVTHYLTKSIYAQTLTVMGTYKQQLQKYAPQIPLVLGETATTNMGGCKGFSDRFIAGFYFLYILGAGAANGIAQINRQDLAGWSSQTEPSQYMLAGQPGWTNGTLTPHSDWFVAALFKQLVQPTALNVSWSSASYGDSFDAHAFCANASRWGAGSIAVLYENMGSQTVSLSLQTQSGSDASAAGPMAWILTSQPVSVEDGSAPPASLTGDSVYCNGKLLSVDSNGLLPTNGIPGLPLPAGQAVQVPPYSFGYLLLPSAGAAACN
jgi:hypothetical protein